MAIIAGEVVKASDATRHACRLTRTGNQAIADATDVAVQFNSELFDDGGLHDNTTNNTRITFVRAGVYVVGGGVEYSNGSTYTSARVSVRMNGANKLAYSELKDTALNVAHLLSVATVAQFAVGDYIELIARQSSGAGRTINLMADYSPIFFAAQIA